MEQALIINDASNDNLYAIATEKNGSIRIFGTTEAAKEWAAWADSKLQGRGKLQEILKFLDVSFIVEGPKPLTRELRAQIAQNSGRLDQNAQQELATSRTEKPSEKSALINILSSSSTTNADGRIGRAPNQRAKKALINYKALAFRHDLAHATFGYDIKKARAVFDPNLAGGNGGWRCPVGTRYGGQITDRYGRGCGWGVARRIANAISDTGQRLERGLDKRRSRSRVGPARAMARPQTRRRGQEAARRVRLGLPERMDRLADRVDGGYGRRPRAERRAGQVGERRTRPGGQTGRLGLPERMERTAREVLEGSYLENRRRRSAGQRARRGSARPQREGRPERMERAAQEVLEGTYLSNRRRRRAASTQQAQERPRVAATPRRPQTQRAAQRPTQRTRTPQPTTPTPRVEPRPESQQPERQNAALPQRRFTLDSDARRSIDRDFKARQAVIDASSDSDLREMLSYEVEAQQVSKARHEDVNLSEPERLRAAREEELSRRTGAYIKRILKNRERANQRESQRPVGTRISDNEIIRAEDLSDDPVKRRRLQREAAEEVRKIERTLGKQRLRLVAANNSQGLTRHIDQLEVEEERLNRVANNQSRDVVSRYKAQQVAEVYRNERRQSILARDRVRQQRRGAYEQSMARRDQNRAQRRAAEEATQAPEASTQRAPLPRGTYTPSQREMIPDEQNINDLNERQEFVKNSRKKVADATEEANEKVREANGDQEKLRKLASEANRRASSFQTIAEGTDLRGRREVPMEERIYAVPEMKAANEAAAIYRTALEKEISLNGPDRPSDERIAEMGEEARKEVKATIKKRAEKLGAFLKRKYGDQDAPWLREDRVKIENWDELSATTEGREKLRKLMRNAYELDEFETPAGLTFKTEIDDISIGRGNNYVSGRILVKDPATGEFVSAGSFSRILMPNEKKVYHDRMFIEPSNQLQPEMQKAVRNSGFAGTFNGHAITWLKAAGFDHAGVSAAADGPFVWPRLGFREQSISTINAINSAMQQQLDNFRSGKRTIIANDRDAAKIEFLLRQRRNEGADIQHNDFILALSNRDDEDQVVRNWFRKNLTTESEERIFGSGKLKFTDDAFPDDPRRVA